MSWAGWNSVGDGASSNEKLALVGDYKRRAETMRMNLHRRD